MSSAGRWMKTCCFMALCLIVLLAGLPWCWHNAELLQQPKHVKVDPVVGHPTIHDTKDARGGDVDGFARRGHPHEGAGIRPAKAPANSDFISFRKHILDLVMIARER